MKKKIIGSSSLIFIILALATYLLWYVESNVPSGVYIEKQTGSIVLEKDESQMLTFEMPIRWVKLHPWEKTLIFEEVSLLDNKGSEIASIHGPYQPDYFQGKRYERSVVGKIEFYLNADRVTDDGGISSTVKETAFQDIYSLSELLVKYNGKDYRYPLEDMLKVILFEQQDFDQTHSWRQEGLMYFEDPESRIPRGFLAPLSGLEGDSLEEILFWIPGMDEDYFETEVQYAF